MTTPKKIRGSGYKHTLPAVWSITAAWVVLVVLAAPALTIAMVFGEVVPESSYADMWFFLLTRMPVIVLAALGLAILTTARVAGPLVQLRRTIEDVTQGDMGRRLRFRRSDKHLRELETAFNEMMESLEGRADARGGLEDNPQVSSTPQA